MAVPSRIPYNRSRRYFMMITHLHTAASPYSTDGAHAIAYRIISNRQPARGRHLPYRTRRKQQASRCCLHGSDRAMRTNAESITLSSNQLIGNASRYGRLQSTAARLSRMQRLQRHRHRTSRARRRRCGHSSMRMKWLCQVDTVGC